MKEDLYTNIVDDLETEELLQCLQAAKLADSPSPEPVSLKDAHMLVDRKLKRTVKIHSLTWISGLSIAAVLAVVVTLLVNRPSATIENTVADVIEEQVESVEEQTIEDIHESTETAPLTEKKPAVKPSEKQEKPTEVSQEDASYAATASMSIFKLISPSKDVYRIRVVDENKSFTFRWDPTGIEGARLILQDKDCNVVLQKDFTTEDHYELRAADVLPYGEIIWSMLVQFEDGREARSSGLISFVKSENNAE